MGPTFFAEHLSPGERLGELLFGLLMTLTFTIGAGVLVGTSEGASSALMFATIGCNVAWGIIDGALLVLQRMFDRRRLATTWPRDRDDSGRQPRVGDRG
jgi:hypothetical protein